MKKSILSASIAAMIGGLGLAGVANAAIVYNTSFPALQVSAVNAPANSVNRAGATVAAPGAAPAADNSAATNMGINTNDVGQVLLVPYFTTNGTNASLLNITNTDRTNGKLVKVRFRGASNSDDLLDFTLLMSPGDVWTGNVSKNAAGISVLTTSDTSCTIPTLPAAGQPFGTGRLNPALTGDALAAETREGYVELLVMANIPPAGNLNQAAAAAPAANPLFTAVKHVNNVPPCAAATRDAATTAAMNLLNTDITNTTAPYLDLRNLVGTNPGRVDTTTAQGKGLDFPTGGLMGNWIIIDTVKTATFSGTATALAGTGSVTAGVNAGNIVFFPQMNVPYNVGGVTQSVDNFTADPLLQTTAANIVRWDGITGNPVAGSGTPFIVPQFSDLPDLSTPYVANLDSAVNPLRFAYLVTSLLASTSTVNEFLTTTSIGATTDWVFSMPTRRYSIAMNYGHTGNRDGRVRSMLQTNAGVTDEYFTFDSTNVNNGRICALGDINNGLTQWNREESTTAAVPGFSPGTFTQVRFCGEAAVLGINNGTSTASGSLSSTLAYQGVTLNFNEGWARIGHVGALGTTAAVPSVGTFATASKGMPVMGGAFVKSSSFGAMWTHRSGL